MFARVIMFFNRVLSFFAPLVDLCVRTFVSYQFFIAGVTKMNDFNNTVQQFSEYSIPYLSAHWAVITSTGIELVFPVLLFLGIFGQFSALALFIFNCAALWFAPALWTPEYHHAFMQHLYWGSILGLLFVTPRGKISLDYFLLK